MLYQTEGLILAVSDIGENDRLLTLFTRTEGKVKCVAKGARKPGARLASLTQPFTYALFQLFRGQSIDRLTQVDSKTTFPGIMQDYEKLVLASYICEVVSEVLPERERNDPLLGFILNVLRTLDERSDILNVAEWGTIGILRRAGFIGDLLSCAVCGRSGVGEGWVFSTLSGGVVCHDCSAKLGAQHQVKMSSAGLKLLSILFDTSFSRDCPRITAAPGVFVEVFRILRGFIEHILEKRLKTSSLVESIEDEALYGLSSKR